MPERSCWDCLSAGCVSVYVCAWLTGIRGDGFFGWSVASLALPKSGLLMHVTRRS